MLVNHHNNYSPIKTLCWSTESQNQLLDLATSTHQSQRPSIRTSNNSPKVRSLSLRTQKAKLGSRLLSRENVTKNYRLQPQIKVSLQIVTKNKILLCHPKLMQNTRIASARERQRLKIRWSRSRSWHRARLSSMSIWGTRLNPVYTTTWTSHGKPLKSVKLISMRQKISTRESGCATWSPSRRRACTLASAKNWIRGSKSASMRITWLYIGS